MWWESLGLARDAGLILLGLEFLILGAIPLLVLRAVTRALRGFLPRVRPGLRQAAGVVMNVQGGVQRAMDAVASPVIRLHAARAQVGGVAAAWARMLLARRKAE